MSRLRGTADPCIPGYHRAMLERPTTTLLEDAIDIPTWLATDDLRPLAERVHRDREIGRALGDGDTTGRIRGWWREIGGREDSPRGQRVRRTRNLISVALALLGLAAGSGLALTAFRYDGTYPVNVVRLLALLVAPQIVLLLLNLFLIPGRVPGLRFVQDALSAFNPGALAAAIYRQLSGETGLRAFAWAAAPSAAMRRFAKWQMLTWSQIAAVALNLGVIGTAAALIAFTDLAFGWTTTLDVGSASATRIFGAIAAPWAALFPGSVPDLTLVERSQYFRLEGYTALADSRELTGWWSFTVLAVVTYGLMPRLVFLAAASFRLRAATRNLLLGDMRVVALLERMSAPDLETQGVDALEPVTTPGPTARVASRAKLAGEASVVIWGQSVEVERARQIVRERLGFSAVAAPIDAGSGALVDERQSLQRLAGTQDTIAVLTPAWEPPLLEFVDFLATLRETVGPSRPIVVVPVAEDGGQIAAFEQENWSRAVGRTRDPNVYVDAGTP